MHLYHKSFILFLNTCSRQSNDVGIWFAEYFALVKTVCLCNLYGKSRNGLNGLNGLQVFFYFGISVNGIHKPSHNIQILAIQIIWMNRHTINNKTSASFGIPFHNDNLFLTTFSSNLFYIFNISSNNRQFYYSVTGITMWYIREFVCQIIIKASINVSNVKLLHCISFIHEMILHAAVFSNTALFFNIKMCRIIFRYVFVIDNLNLNKLSFLSIIRFNTALSSMSNE